MERPRPRGYCLHLDFMCSSALHRNDIQFFLAYEEAG
jgi:hypothetical protein